MKKTFFALAVAAFAGASPAANADVFARSYNDITNFVISASDGIAFGETVDNSFATACMPNKHCISNGGVGIPSAPAAQIGWASYVDDSYASNKGAPNSYIVADASIDSHQVYGAPFTRARNFSEGQLLANATANSTAGNSSASAFSTTFVVGQPGATLNFRFDAHPYLEAYLSANAARTSQAEGSLALNISIIDSTGKVVFNWAPDGVAGGLLGGTESADAFTL
ncbi:MAG TPA: EDSAP-1 family PEP-CTERM protein, partial [Janthinobacterium sp.]|nr:EDSAP-1 family PEP-CTERM protein [Janthinobacterium sp.]